MKVTGRTAIVTGGGGGIGGALVERLVAAGARVVATDLNEDGLRRVMERAAAVTPDAAIAVPADVTDQDALASLIDRAEREYGPVGMFFANAGVADGSGLPDEDAWTRSIEVNLRAHVRAARLLVPRWIERGEGYFVSTASAAGLLTQIGSATYAVTKHAAVGFAEWLSVTYGDQGVRVSCLCPMGVNTAMLGSGFEAEREGGSVGAATVRAAGDVLEPSVVADDVLAAIDEERFLILPHPEVLEFYRRKGRDYDRWLRGMRRLQANVTSAG